MNSTPHLTRVTRAIFSRAWLKRTSCIFFVCCLEKESLSHAHVMFHTLLDPPLTSSALSTPTSSSLWTGQPPALHQQDSCLAVLPNSLRSQSPLTGYEPNVPVEVNSREVTPTLLPLRKGSTGSTCKSGEDIATTPAVSAMDERSNLGMLASQLLSQERERQVRTQSDFVTPIATFRVARLTLQTRKLWWMSRPAVTRVTFDVPECVEP